MIAAVSTAKPTVPRNTQKCFKKKSSSGSDSCNEHSPKKSQISERSFLKNDGTKFRCSIRKPKPNRLSKIKVKFKPTIKGSNFPKAKRKHNKVVIAVPSSETIDHQSNLSMRKEITTGKGLSVPLCEGEEIVSNLKK